MESADNADATKFASGLDAKIEKLDAKIDKLNNRLWGLIISLIVLILGLYATIFFGIILRSHS